MGFGILFVGYFVAMLMSINTFGAIFKLVGIAIIFVALGKLNKYSRTFTYTQIGVIAFAVACALDAVADICTFMYDEMLVASNPLAQYTTFIGYAEIVTSFIFNVTLLYAIRCIAIETEAEKVAVSAVRNFIVMCVYYVMYLVAVLPFSFTEEYLKYCGAFILLLNFVWIILNLVLLYSCYARICDENDVEMNRKPSKFAFVNKMRAEADERRENAAIRQAEYRRQKREKRERRKH